MRHLPRERAFPHILVDDRAMLLDRTWADDGRELFRELFYQELAREMAKIEPAGAAAKAFGGLKLVASDVVPQSRVRGHPDWRERLARNLSRPSTGKWEALAYRVPSAYVVSGDLRTARPAQIVAIYDLAE